MVHTNTGCRLMIVCPLNRGNFNHPRPLLLGYRVRTLLCRGSGLPVLFLLAPANWHDVPFAGPLLTLAVTLYRLRPRVVRLDAGYWGLCLIVWIHTTLGAVAVIPWNPKRQKNRSCLPPTWTADELGKRTAIERFFGRVFSLFSFFRLQRPPLSGWSAVASRVALTYTPHSAYPVADFGDCAFGVRAAFISPHAETLEFMGSSTS